MNADQLTMAVVVGTLIVILLIDFLMLRAWGLEGTISRTIRRWAVGNPWVTLLAGFLCGLLMGHFFL